MLNNFSFQSSSFWLGFLAGALFLWIVMRLRALLPEFIRWANKQIQAARTNLTTSTENRLRNDTVNYVQRMHLAASMFSLDEIVITPRVIAPPIPVEVDPDTVYVDITDETIAYMPDWPEMASWYGAPTLTLPQALSKGASLVLIGQPGAGKTTALAHLASVVSSRSASAVDLKDRLPMFMHVIDLPLKTIPKEIQDPITSALGSYVSALALPRLPELVRSTLEAGHALLILDGLDELPSEEFPKISSWLGQLLQKYPKTQVIAAASADNYAGLNQLGFRPLALASWNEQQVIEFIDQWDDLWNKHISPLLPGASEFIDTMLLNNWLKTRESHPTPFELTLRTWATFAGDILGNDLASLIETHLRRLTMNIPNSRQALERVAVFLIQNMKTSVTQEEVRTQIAEFETSLAAATKAEIEPPASEASPQAEDAEKKTGKATQSAPRGSQLVSVYINNGVFASHDNSRLRFFHPLFTTYLAGHATAADGNITPLMQQSDWHGKWQTLGFAGCFADLSSLVNVLLPTAQADLLYRDLFRMARWLQTSPKQAPWRANILRALATMVQKEYLTLGLATRAVCALGLSGDPGIASLFRQLLRSEQPNLRRMGALGSGLICDAKAVPDLEQLIEDLDPQVGKSACLALVGIGNKTALDAVVATLLQGSELMRRAAAEALVNNPAEGASTLEEGANVDDLLVRRSVVFGYMRLNQPAYTSLLEKFAVEDAQWVVRNSATHALETLRQPNPHIPNPPIRVTDLPWLIAYAGKQGIGVQPGKPALDLISKMLENGDEEEKLAALEYLRFHGSDFGIHRLYNAYFGNLDPIRQAAFDALWHIAASGVPLPPPAQFGLGAMAK